MSRPDTDVTPSPPGEPVKMRTMFRCLAAAGLLVGCSYSPLAPVPQPLPEALEWTPGPPPAVFVGLKTEENDSRSLDALFFDPGVRVTRVVEHSPAAHAGLEPGDVVLAMDGRAVDDPAELDALLADAGPGAEVVLEVRRDDTVFAVSLVPEGDGAPTGDATPLYRTDPARSRAGWATDAHGARLVSLADDSPLRRAGLAPGDTVVSVDGHAVRTDRALIRRLQSLPPGARVRLGVLDGEAVRDVPVRLVEQPRRLTSINIPILVQYETDADATATTFCILDFWIFAVFKYERVGEERTWSMFRIFSTSSGVGTLAE